VLLKKLHTLTLKSFLPPFVITLFVSVFLFFLVEIVITYLDDLLGKGLRTIDIVQLFVYAWIAIIPQCIPLAVLLASIMSFGNLAENYELAAMKSSGLSLFRIIKPVFVFIVILAALTFAFNNFVLPVVQLKFQSLLWDIRQKKPTVSVKEGIFYNKIDNYSIRVGSKSLNKDTLKEIYIYDHSLRQGNTIQMYARSGKMTTSRDSSTLILTLKDGNRYEEIINANVSAGNRPLSQLNFKQLQVNIELVDFKLKRTAEENWKGNENMLNIWQLDSVADSTRRKIDRRYQDIKKQVAEVFYYRTITGSRYNQKFRSQSIKQFYDSLSFKDHKTCIDNALSISRSNADYFESMMVNIQSERNDHLRFLTEWHRRIVISFACIVLFFVGAPLGAIIKKGGLGLPVVVAVFFFLAYFVLTEAFSSLAYDGTLIPWQAIWMPLIIFLPVSIFLTYKAARDSALFDLTVYFDWVKKIFLKKQIA
jgi:lipopolysaccharide export system permease protein